MGSKKIRTSTRNYSSLNREIAQLKAIMEAHPKTYKSLSAAYGVGGNTFRSSDLATVKPVKTNQDLSSRSTDLAVILGPDTAKVVEKFPPAQQKRILKRIKGFTFAKLYSVALGLPSRIRKYVRDIWKREDRHGQEWSKIAPEMALMAAKILNQRLELVIFTSIALVEEPDAMKDGRLNRMTCAKTECDALLSLYSHYFTIGSSAKLAADCTSFTGDDSAFYLGGLADVVDYGLLTPGDRRVLQSAATKTIKTNGWKMPERDYQK